MVRKTFSVTLAFSVLFFILSTLSVFAEDNTVNYQYSIEYNGGELVKLQNDPFRDEYSGRKYFPVLDMFKIMDSESGQIELENAGRESIINVETNTFIKQDVYLISFKNSCYQLEDGETNIKVFDGTCTSPTSGTISMLYGIRVKDINSVPTVFAPQEFFEKVLGQSTEIKDNTTSEGDFKLTIRTEDYNKFREANNKSIILKLNDPWMYVNNNVKKLDPDAGSTPVAWNGRTLLPISSIITEFGGTVKWNANEQKVSISLESNTVDLWLNETKALVNGVEKTLDVGPTIIKNRTMVPLKFITDNLGIKLVWDDKNQIIALYKGDFDLIPVSYDGYFHYDNNTQS